MSDIFTPVPNPTELKDGIQITSLEQIEAIRARISAGEVPSQEELRAAVDFFRAARTAASVAAPKGKKTPITTDAALSALDDLIGGL